MNKKDLLNRIKSALENRRKKDDKKETARESLEQMQHTFKVFADFAREGASYLKELKDAVEFMRAEAKRPPEWYQPPVKEMVVEAKDIFPVVVENPVEEVEIKGTAKVEVVNLPKQDGNILEVVQIFFAELARLLAGLFKKTFRVMPDKEHYTTPQYVMIYDPKKGRPVSVDEFGVGIVSVARMLVGGGSGIAQKVGIKGAGTIGDGTTTVTTAGTRVQLPDQECNRVFIQSHPSNTGEVVIGGSTVVASAGTRRGLALFTTQWQEFQVTNLNKLWIDSTQNGDKINYIFEL